ncbi:MAG: M55 family metallopeptidase [Candidatus Aminicenantes bacterium]|nr:M55 family metallopeptidase [Candidatus Aminicenantes bacterium]MDH5383664.1 M55 family metallopeptidase [Candidatus Aminicenantes bacterium]
MRKFFIFFIFIVISFTLMCATSQKDFKVFISVDMEGLAGVVSGVECSSRGPDYDYFRKIMTEETNAAIEGALESGATEIVVRDGHGAKTNIIHGLLHKKAKLLRGVTSRPENMMLGIDETFDAVLFIGYHAKAGTEEGVLAHTSSGNVIDLSVNGVSLPEGGYNALIAGLYDVPAVFVAGDNWICTQLQNLLGEILTCETKIGMGSAELGLHPDVVCERIRKGVADALSDLSRFKPYKLTPPYTMTLKVKKERELYPGANKTGEGEFVFTSSDFLKIMDAFNKMK